LNFSISAFSGIDALAFPKGAHAIEDGLISPLLKVCSLRAIISEEYRLANDFGKIGLGASALLILSCISVSF